MWNGYTAITQGGKKAMKKNPWTFNLNFQTGESWVWRTELQDDVSYNNGLSHKSVIGWNKEKQTDLSL